MPKYHVITGLETLYPSLSIAESMLFWAKNPIQPSIPLTANPTEDRTTPRICVADTIEDCITGIGLLGKFRRCLSANEDAKSYENDDEAYPIFVLEFPDGLDYYTPSKAQVSDVGISHEKWLLKPTLPSAGYVKWLNAYSITCDENFDRCLSVRFIDDLSGYHHPWLDRKGHPLDSSLLANETWPGNLNHMTGMAESMLYHDRHVHGCAVFAVPVTNAVFRCWKVHEGTYGFSMDEASYLLDGEYLHPYTGFRDMDGNRIFEHNELMLDGTIRIFSVTKSETTLRWTAVGLNGSEIPLDDTNAKKFRIL